ncbi:calcium-binding protein [Inquilinus sp. NPDC058860]|uniref:calcium-binding protein n=1 Tax=Inquilinus sp. NPDC058860 TaxID=3346652 RepID=UPI0036A04DAD
MASIVGTSGNDFIHVPGQGGTAPGLNDMPVATDTGDTIDGAAGNDRIIAGLGADTITGGIGNDTISGGAGEDMLLGDAGADTLTGGAGFDTLSYAASAAGVSLVTSLTPGSGGDAQGDLILQDSSIEKFVGSAFDDHITADAGVLDGGAGNDVLSLFNYYYRGPVTLIGGAGDDTLSGNGLDATFIGGTGADRFVGAASGPAAGVGTVSYADSSAGVRINLTGGANGGAAGVGGDAEGDIFIRIKSAIGSAFDDILTGNDGGNVLRGGDGNDILLGRGSDSPDFLARDILDGGNGIDTADYGASTVGVHVDLIQGTGDDGSSLADQLISIESVTASSHDDVVIGNGGVNGLWGFAGDDSLSGNGGNDSLKGGAGQDLLEGGSGADRLDGGDGIDTAVYTHSALAVTVDLGTNSGLFGEAQGDTFAGIENVVGSAGGDTLKGGAGANMLSGEDSNDRLTGAGGADVLNGGAGGDLFTYRAIGDSTVAVAGRDTIQDFNSLEQDRIDLGQIDADGNAGNGNSTFSFIGTGAFTGAGAEVRFTAAGGDLLVQGDVNGDKVADFAILVQGTLTLTAADFVL